jgi:hypothetical protein
MFLFFSYTNVDIRQEKLLSKLVRINTDDTSTTTNFNYNGNQLISIISDTKKETYEYTGNLITKITVLDMVCQKSTVYNYSYTNNKLTKIVSSKEYEINFTYNSDQSISYEKVFLNKKISLIILTNI